MDRALRAALLKLQRQDPVPASQFTASQRGALDRFGRQTGAVLCQPQGRGTVYRIGDPQRFAAHLAALAPQIEAAEAADLPLRARHIAQARNSKAGPHRHQVYYSLLKAIGDNVTWRNAGTGLELPLSRLTQDFGAASLGIAEDDDWRSEQDLWLIENQALFDRVDWLPDATQATLLYYGGQVDGRLLSWLAFRPRAPRILLFPDYDGVGLANFARLHARLGDICTCWLMPDWQRKLTRYGNPQLWRDTLDDFSWAAARLPAILQPLMEQMHQSGLALEQEAVWLPA